VTASGSGTGSGSGPAVANGAAGLGPAERLTETFGPGPVVIGPTAPTLAAAHASARDALQGLRAVTGWPAAPRPVRAEDLLPERALAGDPWAKAQLITSVVQPLTSAGGELGRTLASYLDGGGALASTPIRCATGYAECLMSPASIPPILGTRLYSGSRSSWVG
jgi:hypothetical protein